MGSAGHLALINELRKEYIILVGNPERKEPLGDLGINGRILLN
jgi:hypothetical protein